MSSVFRLLRLMVACVIWGGMVFAFLMATVSSTNRTYVLVDGEEYFYYFGYGSNLLRERLLLLNPSAVRASVGRLKGYKLAFGLYKRNLTEWGGGVATIIQSPEDDVWGVVWRLKAADRQSLDDQENVKEGFYSPIEVKIEREDAGEMMCLTYQINYFNSVLPSPLYKEVICTGAKQNGLPAEYIAKLDAIKTNNYNETTPFTIHIGSILCPYKTTYC
ncbi:gamma-glutamylcyclotransferase-like [Heterodontus francisci]|uniref:gamma-glutamylcyclotransferase-like n=1 Tax=Heterodontus francisci TaxID=7792 RepID=UPI00355B38B9